MHTHHTHECTRTHTFTRMCMRTQTHMDATCMHIHTRTHAYTLTHASTCIYIHAHDVYAWSHVCSHIHTYAHTHTHIYLPEVSQMFSKTVLRGSTRMRKVLCTILILKGERGGPDSTTSKSCLTASSFITVTAQSRFQDTPCAVPHGVSCAFPITAAWQKPSNWSLPEPQP